MWWEKEGHLEVKDNKLFIGGLSAKTLAEKYGTPLYVYSKKRILENFNELKNAFSGNEQAVRIHYAMKANSNLEVLRTLKDAGAYIDAVSPLEAETAIKAGFPKERIMFTGTSVSNDDLIHLLELGVFLNIDSVSQIRRLQKLTDKKLDISVRWNPGEGAGAGHHSHTITAGKYVKFGIPEHKLEDAVLEAKKAGFNIVGLHQHIGSGWLKEDVPTFLSSVDKTINTAKKIEAATGKKLSFIDFGGGPGIPYTETQKLFPIDEYAKGISEKIKSSGMDVVVAIEPGRFIVGDAGILLVEANTVEEKNILVVGVNAGFNTLARPAMYGAYQEIVVCDNVDSTCKKEYMVAGILCETGDVFTENKKILRSLPQIHEGDILAILDTGAYGFSMASTYNSRPLSAEVMINNGAAKLVRRCQTLDDLLREQEAP